MAISKISGISSKLSTPTKTAAASNALAQLQRQLASQQKLSAPTVSGSKATTSGAYQAKNAGFGTYSPTALQTAGKSGSGTASLQSNARQASTGSTATPAASAATFQQRANTAAAATGGTPTGTPAPGAQGPTGGAQSAFGKSFTPDSFQMMFANPDALIRSWFAHGGRPTGGGELAMSQDQNARNLLLMYTLFGGQDPSQGGGQFGPYADWSDQYLQRGLTPGAAYYSGGQVLDRLMTDNPNDPIYNQLYNDQLDAAGQSNNFISAYLAAMGNTMAPEILGAHRARLEQLEQQFIGEQAQGKHPGVNFGQYLTANGWG